MSPKKKSSTTKLSASESTGGYRYKDYRDGGGNGGSRDYGSRYSYPQPLSRRNGYGHDYDYHDPYGDHKPEKYGGSFDHYGHEKKECCPLVIKPLVFLALLGTLAAATAFLNVLITMNIGRKRRRRRRRSGEDTTVLSSSSSSSLSPESPGITVYLDRLLDLVHQGRRKQKTNT